MRIGADRLHHQHLEAPSVTEPAKVAAWFGAIQAQDYLASLWALGLRTANATEARIEAALEEGRILRTHAFRGTWQLIARDDVRWMVELVGSRVIGAAASRYRSLGLPPDLLDRATALIASALSGGRSSTRGELAAVLTRAGFELRSEQLIHMLGYAELRGVICSGGRRGKQLTFALLDERAGTARRRSREEALTELGVRYLQSRAPATERDFAWWSGLPLAEVRLALALLGARVVARDVDGVKYWALRDSEPAPRRRGRPRLLPAFDELLVGYADRGAFVDPQYLKVIHRGGGMLRPALLLGGKVAGTWQRSLEAGATEVSVKPFRTLTPAEHDSVSRAVAQYGRFLGRSATLVLE